MKKKINIVIAAAFFLVVFYSIALAATAWKDTSIRKMTATVSYVDQSGKKILRNFTGVYRNFFEIYRDDVSKHHIIRVHSENNGGLQITVSAIGSALSKASESIFLTTWGENASLGDPVLNFNPDILMYANDVKSALINGSYTLDSNSNCSVVLHLTATGNLKVRGVTIPAQITLSTGGNNIPPTMGTYSSNPAPRQLPTANVLTVYTSIKANRSKVLNLISDSQAKDYLGSNNLIIVGLNQPARGTARLASGLRKVIYTTPPGFAGDDSFYYSVQDQYQGVNGPYQVKLTVVSLPAAMDDFTTWRVEKNEGEPGYVGLSIDLSKSINNFNNSLSISIDTQPLHGQATQPVNGFTTYTPKPGFGGLDYFKYKVAAKNNVAGFIGVTVLPVAYDDYTTISKTMTSLKLNANFLLANDESFGGAKPTLVKVFSSLSSSGSAVFKNNTIIFNPKFVGHTTTESFAYTMTDGAKTSTARVIIRKKP